jgi:superfamily I DNA/RNA helicase
MNAVAEGLDASLAIVGKPGSGKSVALRERLAALRARDPEAGYYVAAHPRELANLAVELLQLRGFAVTIVDDVEASLRFARSARPLLDLDWDDLVSGEIDPEVPGLRSPERFLDAAFRLVRKLAEAAISPKVFLERCLTGATKFYANPPNFAHPDLILGTKDAYRTSLDVTPKELERRREVDLAKILARLYTTYVEQNATTMEMTERDAIAFAVQTTAEQSDAARLLRKRYPHAFVDDAQEMTAGARALLQAVYGERLHGVTLAGDPNGALGIFNGAIGAAAFENVECRVELEPDKGRREPELHLHRAKTQADEATYVAREIVARIEAGAAFDDIAVLFRSVADVHHYEEALLANDVPAIVCGDVNVFADRRALDALALLWNLWDPFRHEYVLRTLSARAMALSDASIATLCSEPPDAQAPLFELVDELPPLSRRGRFDAKRDLRLGWNLTRGTVDDVLDPSARERVVDFRKRRQEWLSLLPHAPLRELAVRVWNDGLAAEGVPGSARARAQEVLLQRLLARLCSFEAAHPDANLGDVLNYAQARAQSDLETCEDDPGTGFVQLRSIEAARGRLFDVVVLPDVRAGSFPRWYVPDAFLFSAKLGMIPKDNVGDARASRTAKFSYYLHATKARETYNGQERRAFLYAMSRARREVLVTAAGKATRGVTAPEFLAELQST